MPAAWRACAHRCVALVIAIVAFGGCAATVERKPQRPIAPTETREDVVTAVEAVVDAVRSPHVRVKYCPVCGRRYSSRLMVCPHDGSELKILEE